MFTNKIACTYVHAIHTRTYIRVTCSDIAHAYKHIHTLFTHIHDHARACTHVLLYNNPITHAKNNCERVCLDMTKEYAKCRHTLSLTKRQGDRHIGYTGLATSRLTLVSLFVSRFRSNF